VGRVLAFLASCGKNFNSMSSGEADWVAVAKAPIGSTCSRLWSATGYWIRAVSGAFIEYGLSKSAMGDLLAEDFFSIVAKDTLYRCLDSLFEYKAELFEFLDQRWAVATPTIAI
jgi:hypothetical protein